MAAVLATFLVLGGCQTNLLALEYIILDPEGKKYGSALTFMQFLFVAFCTSFENMEIVPPGEKVKSSRYSILPVRFVQRQLDGKLLFISALLFWALSVLGNMVFRFNISIPLSSVFRSGSLLLNILIGRLFFKRIYTRIQLICGVMVTGGLVALTLMTMDQVSKDSSEDDEALSTWIFGMVLMIITVCVAPTIGILQDLVFVRARQKFKVHSRPFFKEAVFYAHLWVLPFFLIFSWPEVLDFIFRFPPHLYPFLLLNVVSQYVCIRAVYALTECTSAFTMTLAITIRKYISLFVSIMYFGHWKALSVEQLGAFAFIMTCALLYAFLPILSPSSPSKQKVGKAKSL